MSEFQNATRAKLRFSTNKGHLSTEDLWDLSLESLDSIAKTISKAIKEENEESFIDKKINKDDKSELKLKIIKIIIKTKLEEKEKIKNKLERDAKISQLKELAITKANESLQNLSLEEINKMISDLQKSE